MTPSSPHEPRHERFSLPLFAVTIVVTFACLAGLLRWFAPDVWAAQFVAPAWKAAVAFGLLSLAMAFVEYFFHRYVLHTPAIPFLSRFYRQHTLHHALTRIVRRPGRDGKGLLVVENMFPIIEDEQHEAAFFPWYSMAVFGFILTPLLALLHGMCPGFPWFLSGFAALASSLSLYEVLHAIEHWPLEKWEPLVTHRRWGWFWQPVYGFHLRHHAVIDCNESISGFFGLPVADWILGTCVIPRTVYANGEEGSAEKFRSPRPCALIRVLDGWAASAVGRNRARLATIHAKEACVLPKQTLRPYSRGEVVANWLTHGLGAALAVTSLTLLVVFASLRGGAWHVVSFTVFGSTLLFLYMNSTLHYAWPVRWGRHVFRRSGRAAIFLLIAGTLTPFLLGEVRGLQGWMLGVSIWAVCGAGAVFKLFCGDRVAGLSKVAYSVAACVVLIALRPLAASIPAAALWLLLAGVLSYAAGATFHSRRAVRYHRTFWHTFVLAGSSCHVIAVLFLLQPTAA